MSLSFTTASAEIVSSIDEKISKENEVKINDFSITRDDGVMLRIRGDVPKTSARSSEPHFSIELTIVPGYDEDGDLMIINAETLSQIYLKMAKTLRISAETLEECVRTKNGVQERSGDDTPDN